MKKMIILMVVVVLVLLGIAIYDDLSNSQQWGQEQSSLSSTPGDLVLGVNLNLDPQFNEKDFFTGNAVLVLSAGSVTQAEAKYNLVRSVEQLISYDTNNDHKLNASDPSFKYFSLFYIDPKTHIRQVIPIEKVGVRAILFNIDVMNAILSHRLQKENAVIAYFLMGDSSRRPARFIWINSDNWKK